MFATPRLLAITTAVLGAASLLEAAPAPTATTSTFPAPLTQIEPGTTIVLHHKISIPTLHGHNPTRIPSLIDDSKAGLPSGGPATGTPDVLGGLLGPLIGALTGILGGVLGSAGQGGAGATP